MLSESMRRALKERLLPEEREEDLQALVEILADARAKARGTPRAEPDEKFAATVLCAIFDPVKTQSYRESVENLRREFAGIAQSNAIRQAYIESLSPALLGAAKPADAIKRGFNLLFDVFKGAAL